MPHDPSILEWHVIVLAKDQYRLYVPFLRHCAILEEYLHSVVVLIKTTRHSFLTSYYNIIYIARTTQKWF